ncbi:MAG: peptidase MA family metallohydrolase [Myxococcales bacterium]|nr:peptidase MA family metallohydrolase [Myxococcales bacterium]
MPARIPGGYTAERLGPVHWIYPSSAESEVRTLQAEQARAFRQLEHRLGLEVAPELAIRVGINPEHMQQLAPKGAKLPSYATGVAFSEHGLILMSMTDPKSFMRPDMEQLLMHEMSHVALHRALQGHAAPRWLNEGLAVHFAGERSIARTRVLWDGTLRGKLHPLSSLDAAFPARHDEVSLAYAQSSDLVDYLLDSTADRARFRNLILGLSRGIAFDEAFAKAYGLTIGQLESQWQGALRRRFGRWPSLLMGLGVVWVAGAILLLVGYVRVRRRHHRTLDRWAIEEAPASAAIAALENPPALLLSSAESEAVAAWPKNATSGPAPAADTDAHRGRDSGIPTVEHEGRNHTLH